MCIRAIDGNPCYLVTAGFEDEPVANLTSQLALAYMLAKTPDMLGKLRQSKRYWKQKFHTTQHHKILFRYGLLTYWKTKTAGCNITHVTSHG